MLNQQNKIFSVLIESGTVQDKQAESGNAFRLFIVWQEKQPHG